MTSLRKRQSGFTIVELLIVIIIIGILATLVIVQFTNQQKKARDTQRKTDINAISSQLEAYYAENGAYPLDVAGVTAMPGMKTEATTSPNDIALSATAPAAGKANDRYSYTATDCDTEGCNNYSVSAWLEADDELFTKASEN